MVLAPSLALGLGRDMSISLVIDGQTQADGNSHMNLMINPPYIGYLPPSAGHGKNEWWQLILTDA
jgi:hypothetical protein